MKYNFVWCDYEKLCEIPDFADAWHHNYYNSVQILNVRVGRRVIPTYH